MGSEERGRSGWGWQRPSGGLCDRADGGLEGRAMRLQPPQGTHLMGIQINDHGSGDAFYSLKQKLPGEEKGQ